MCLAPMVSLPLLTWIRFFVWLAVGLAIYVFYGTAGATARSGGPTLASPPGGRGGRGRGVSEEKAHSLGLWDAMAIVAGLDDRLGDSWSLAPSRDRVTGWPGWLPAVWRWRGA